MFGGSDAGWETHWLDERNQFFMGWLPEQLRVDQRGFEALWDLHPEEYHQIMIHGRVVSTPRWQQAYGADYHYTGRTNVGLPEPAELAAFQNWARKEVDERFNGLLLNWYDGSLGHAIGAHHDSTSGMILGAPIVTISLGEERVFRLTRPKSKARWDFIVRDGSVCVMPYGTNLVWKHGVPRLARFKGRRISITLRAFQMK